MYQLKMLNINMIDTNIIDYMKVPNFHHSLWASIAGNLQMSGRQVEVVEIEVEFFIISHHHHHHHL
jgi:hypothetical protein